MNIENVRKLRDYIATLPEEKVAIGYRGSNEGRYWKHCQDLFPGTQYAAALELSWESPESDFIGNGCKRLEDKTTSDKERLLWRLDFVLSNSKLSIIEKFNAYYSHPVQFDVQYDYTSIDDFHGNTVPTPFFNEYVNALAAELKRRTEWS